MKKAGPVSTRAPGRGIDGLYIVNRRLGQGTLADSGAELTRWIPMHEARAGPGSSSSHVSHACFHMPVWKTARGHRVRNPPLFCFVCEQNCPNPFTPTCSVPVPYPPRARARWARPHPSLRSRPAAAPRPALQSMVRVHKTLHPHVSPSTPSCANRFRLTRRKQVINSCSTGPSRGRDCPGIRVTAPPTARVQRTAGARARQVPPPAGSPAAPPPHPSHPPRPRASAARQLRPRRHTPGPPPPARSPSFPAWTPCRSQAAFPPRPPSRAAHPVREA